MASGGASRHKCVVGIHGWQWHLLRAVGKDGGWQLELDRGNGHCYDPINPKETVVTYALHGR